MPIYEYHCTDCDCEFEVRRSFSDTSEVFCPKCENRAERVFSPVPIVFKGSGFYVTDMKNRGKSSPESSSGCGDSCKTCSSTKSE